jgi:AcrR family transcriptional regulator
MNEDAKSQRQDQIADAAYALLAEKGFQGMSMLAVARRAKASNETLYKWYGDKAGLFCALIERNAAQMQELLDQSLHAGLEPKAALAALAPLLQEVLLGDRAVALNRAAAADATGALGQALARSGREAVLPKLAQVMQELAVQGEVQGEPAALSQLFVDLVIGDQQIRRVIGVMERPTDDQIKARAALGLDRFYHLTRAA